MPLIDERDNTFSCTHGGAKFLAVALVYGSGARNEIGRRPYYEEPSGRYRGEESETCPFHKFAEIVGRGDIAVKSFGGQIVVGVAWLSQMADYVVGVQVDAHAKEEYGYAQDRQRTKQERRTLVEARRRKREESLAYQYAVDDIKRDAHQHYGNRHTALSLHQKRKNKRPLEIMQLKKQEGEESRQGCCRPIACPHP